MSRPRGGKAWVRLAVRWLVIQRKMDLMGTQIMLSNYGHRVVEHRLRSGTLEQEPGAALLCALFEQALLPSRNDQVQADLLARGLIQRARPEDDAAAVRLRYARNPLQHVIRLIFEYTTVCNLDCQHCRNGHLPAVTEKDPAVLKRAVDVMVGMGVSRFDFVGGEVTLYGRGWLEVTRHIATYPGARAGVITSGWFLGERDFAAAGQRYADDGVYLRALRDAGLTFVIFSLDGPEALHDRTRQVPGLYRRVLEGLDKVRRAGLSPRLSLLVSPEVPEDALEPWIVDLARRLYDQPGAPEEDLVRRLMSDRANYISNLIDIGNGARLKRAEHALDEIPDALIRCKNFFRPAPNLRIKASGELSLCPLIEGGDGYGSLHERDLLSLLNEMQEALPYRLHASGALARYRRFLDESLYGGRLDHVCTLRTALMMLARGLDDEGIGPDDVAVDQGLVRRLNIEVAKKCGFLPELRQIGKAATGHPRPR